MPESAKSTPKATVVAGMVGNALEWYDFAVYGYLAPILGRLFFPADDPVTSLLAAFGAFAAGYAARPVGAALLGHLGDTVGRKPALLLSMTIMGAATFAIGFLPDHATIGATAALLLVVLRVVQGLSAGGEYSGSIVLLGEHAPPARRGISIAWAQFGTLIGFLLGSGIGALMSTLLSDAAMLGWGWRVPFLLGGAIAVFGLVIRSRLTESPTLVRGPRPGGFPAVAVIRDHGRAILTLIGLAVFAGVGFYMTFIYAASYLTERMHLSTARALDINTLALVAMLAVTLPAALLSDRFGRRPVLAFALVGMIVLAWPLWWLMHHHSFALILAGQVGFAVFLGIYYSTLPATMMELLPANVRYSGVSIGYNLCLAVFGGTTPLIATYLVARTGDDFVPVYYVIAAAVVSLMALLRIPEMAGKRLP